MNERKTHRHPLSYWLRVFDADQDEPLGTLADLTHEGLSVISDQRGSPGTVLNIRMQLPKEMEGPRELSVAARIRWSRTGSPEGFNRIGLQFLDVDDEAKAVIAKLIEEFPFQEVMSSDSSFYPEDLP